MSGLAVVIVVLSLVGTGVLLYPTAAAWTQQYYQSQDIRDYTADMGATGAEQLAAEVRQAREYNATLTGGATLPANQRKPRADGEQAAPGYDDLLDADGNGLIGRIQIPRIDADLAIYHGTTDDVLEEGVGHLEGTALPVGGVGTHSVLTAHRGLATAELFTRLDEVRVDDTFTVSAFGEVHTYRVRATQVVLPEDTQLLNPVAGEDLITLVTCTPLGVNSHRILVTGERVIPTPIEQLEAAERGPDIPRFPWWALAFAGVLLGGALYLWLSGLQPRVLPALAGARHPLRPMVPVHAAVLGWQPVRRAPLVDIVEKDTAGHLGPSHLDVTPAVRVPDRSDVRTTPDSV
ncbi:class C sortase [Microbacterium sp. 179-B 1A2 NHS]|uniref:class C sortase n=1 Tax=Microbacterium sp. 179-B 1A2 NHS TaxID=3142383 RepID=UPI0039A061B5